MEPEAVETVEAMDADEAHAAMADEVAATKTANGEPMATEAMTAAETMAATSVTTATVTAATVATTASTAGVGDLGQRDDPGDEHCKHQIEQLTTHDTLLLLDGFLPSPYTCSDDGEAAAVSVVFIAVSLSQCPPAFGSRHDGVAGIAALDHERIGALPDQPPRRRLDLDAQRRPALDARAGLVVLRRGGPRDPGNCKGEHRQPGHRYAHGLSPV